jgi:hypothetical protein
VEHGARAIKPVQELFVLLESRGSENRDGVLRDSLALLGSHFLWGRNTGWDAGGTRNNILILARHLVNDRLDVTGGAAVRHAMLAEVTAFRHGNKDVRATHNEPPCTTKSPPRRIPR